ncbi:MAG TPA: hypothetical protein VJ689_06815 [Gaiellaceae bacterium]|nr:hypothetical protein [Gaiellaceae bacterium]
MTHDHIEEAEMDAATTIPIRRELARRHANGVEVTLSWAPGEDALFVTVRDESGDDFELVVDAEHALDTYNHPYAYAAFRGLELLDVAA